MYHEVSIFLWLNSVTVFLRYRIDFSEAEMGGSRYESKNSSSDEDEDKKKMPFKIDIDMSGYGY